MRVTILGCGPSIGVPSLGNNWGQCDPKNSRNRRSRCSILVEINQTVILVDTSPDLRAQLLDANVDHINGVFFTHGHADHTHGLDDLRPMFWRMEEQINIYGDKTTLSMLESRFDYMFKKADSSPPYFRVPLISNTIELSPIKINDIIIEPYIQNHGVSGTSLGFIFNQKFAYSTDVSTMESSDLDRLKGIDVWVVDCLRETKSMAHSHLDQTLEWITTVNPRRSFLTHMTNDIDYDKMLKKLPDTVEPAYDGLVIEL
jgi:phosphoribosyl 1,2-cyclic phosphate phosphodiesterase